MSPISSSNNDSYYQPSEIVYEYNLDQGVEFQVTNSLEVYPREHVINHLFDILSSIEITRYYNESTSVDNMETLLRILDVSIQECENYYSSYRNRHPLFFIIIDRAKEFLNFIREDQHRGLPHIENNQDY
jgi:hypothetical protein